MAGAVLWLHGVGDTGAGWRGNPEFRPIVQRCPGLKWVHPDAPEQALTAAGGDRMNSWFDIVTWVPGRKPIGLEEPDPAPGMDDFVKSVHSMLEQIESQGVPAEKILIGGFSQGGSGAIAAGLTYPKKIGGIVSISGWCQYRKTLVGTMPSSNKSVPIMFCCGNRDDVIDIKLSRESKATLEEAVGENLTYMEANRAGHFQSPAEMDAIVNFMMSKFS